MRLEERKRVGSGVVYDLVSTGNGTRRVNAGGKYKRK